MFCARPSEQANEKQCTNFDANVAQSRSVDVFQAVGINLVLAERVSVLLEPDAGNPVGHFV